MSSGSHFQESKMMIDDLLHAVNGLIEIANGELVALDEEPVEVEVEEQEPEIDLAELEAMGLYEAQLQEVELGIRQKLPVQLYAQNCYNWMQMKEIRLGMLAQVDVKWYTNPLYNAEQMHQIRLGLEYGLDVSGYARLIYTVSDMYKKRHALMEEKYRNGEGGQERYILDEFTRIRIHLSADLMTAWIMVPEGEERIYTVAELRRLLKKYEVRHGIQADGLCEATIQSTRGREILIAQGTSAMPGTDGYYELFFNRELPGSPELLADGSVDYSRVIVADTAQPGQLLAQYRPAGKGKPGMTVTGIALDGETGRDLPPITGSGITGDDARRIYYSAIKGYVTYDAESCKLNVLPTYLVNGDVNSYSGSVIYDGTIHISGAVSGKAMIRATGDVIVDGFVSGGYIEAGHNVILRSGVNAGDQGSIQAGGQIMGKFFERVRLTAGGNIEGNYFLDCSVYSEGRVLAKGGKSRIMGGEMTASAGVEAGIIGNYGSAKTVISVANLYELTEQLENIKEQEKKVSFEREKLEEGRQKLEKLMEDGAVADQRLYQKVLQASQIKEGEWTELELRKEHLKTVKKDAMQASVRALKELRPGTVVVINGVTRMFMEAMSGTTLTEAVLLEKKK
ncbi:MAG: DUF342 domain-containing protein [Lachnospiraceae bacterium]|nr:DUF342 domain-containing protein [Lachnospiraceae bacterium]